MGYTPEPWAKEWLTKQRANGIKCLEVKVSNGNHYVYRSTTRYDPETKRAKKVSEYVGVLDPYKGLIERTKDVEKRDCVVSVKDAGTFRLLDRCCGDLFSALENRFSQNCDQIYALALIWCIDRIPLMRVASNWEKFDSIRDLCPTLTPNSLFEMFKSIGANREAQDLFFKDIGTNRKELVFDLSEFFSQGGKIPAGEECCNVAHDEDAPQLNIALVCTHDIGTPVMFKVIPGSVREVKTVYSAFKEIGHQDAIIVTNCGFYSMGNINILNGTGMNFVMPLERNSLVYDYAEIGENDVFEYCGRSIHFGKCRFEDFWAYRFKDETMYLGEEYNVSVRYKEGKLTKKEADSRRERMGQTVMISNVDLSPEEIYRIVKCKESVKKRFGTFRSLLEADSMYLRDSTSVFGHIFVTFLSMYMTAKLEEKIKQVGPSLNMSAEDVLMEYSKAYVLQYESGKTEYVIPKKLKRLDKQLGIGTFPILQN